MYGANTQLDRKAGRVAGKAAKRFGFGARWRRWLAGLVLIVTLGPVFPILLYALVPPPATPLMLIRALEGEGIDKDWRYLREISPHLQRAVIASEDSKFCTHNGFDWQAIENAWEVYWSDKGRLLGASTISMQTAKNLFLWPGRDFLRKGLEAYLTFWLELLLSKDRILTLYLNIAEWAPGVYGAEAAARHYFDLSARELAPAQAAGLAAILPNPRDWDAARPGPGTAARARTIASRAPLIQLGDDGGCPRR